MLRGRIDLRLRHTQHLLPIPPLTHGIARVEELVSTMRERFTIVMVTHNMGQAKRASDECIYMYLGEIIEHAPTDQLFLNPREEKTAMYIEGRYG